MKKSPCKPEALGVDSVALQRVTAFIEAELAACTFPGAALVATRHGRTFIERYWGTYCGLERPGLPYDGSVVNMLFSFSKGISATVIVMARQEGLIDYDVPVRTYIPEFTGGGKDGITIRQLLTHAAGLVNAGHGTVATQADFDRSIQQLCQAKIDWEPGSKNSYHGASAMMLAAEAVRRVSGMPTWEDLCREHLFQPLGTTSLTFRPAPLPGAPLAVTPFSKEQPFVLDAAHCWQLCNPAAGAFGTIADVLKLLQLHLNGGVWNGRQLIQPEALREMHTIQNDALIEAALARGEDPVREYWGLGWQLRGKSTQGWFGFGNVASPRAFGHAGIDTVMTVADPERDVALAFLTTDSPKPGDKTIPVRNTVTNLLMAAVTGK